MDRRYLTILIIFGFFMVLVGQVKNMVNTFETPTGDPLVEAIEEHVAKENNGVGNFVTTLSGGTKSSRSGKTDLESIAPSQRAPDGYRPYVAPKQQVEQKKLDEEEPLPALDTEPTGNGKYANPKSSYYPVQNR